MAEIVTLTMNPALDVTTSVPQVEPVHKLRCAPPRRDPGGGGINVARVVRALGGDAIALFPAGGPTGAAVSALLAGAGVPALPVPIAGTTRESFTVDETGSGDQFRFILPGPQIAPAELDAVIAALEGIGGPPRWIVVSGSMPPGVEAAALYRRIAAIAARTGARLVIDSSGPALAACEGVRPFLIKPSYSELGALAGRDVSEEAAQVEAARELLARGFAQMVLVSLAERGALLVSEAGAERFAAIPVKAVSGVGAGDSMIAAMVLMLSRGAEPAEAVRWGLAAGAAALLAPGTQLARREDIERLRAALG
ncbi:1-phosphofructokinase family hexose kinase [Sphingomonas canadensis]|uniref:Phosphofructokinase n=1 Tax=Sphingomonas canadensis TaxID=1219257 RepID=A0ABW3H3P0_9SPHN|nr:1-phosphofructokinase family hexose kinase [Sphingomonas canadensis]MCW3835704.1 1-phosphofructokinase family hexose kinase [Sphingomonas canadensis]